MKIIHLDTSHPILIKRLNELGFINDEDYLSSKKMIETKLKDYHGIVIRSRFTIDKSFLDKATKLKFIARVGAGLENIDLSYARKKSIELITAPEGNSNAVGEHALGMLLSLFNKLNKADKEVKAGQWQREANRGIELDGKTVGIFGFGNMGKAFAKKLQGFDTEVLCYDIKSNVGNKYAKQVTLSELQYKADVLSLHTPLSALTLNMVNTTFINQFRKSFWFINTARGKSVLTSDLVKALKNGKLLGVGLDVLEYEKTSFENVIINNNNNILKTLISMDNVILSPHIAGWTVESHIKLAQTIADKIKAKFC